MFPGGDYYYGEKDRIRMDKTHISRGTDSASELQKLLDW